MSLPLAGRNLRNDLKGFVLQTLPQHHRQAGHIRLAVPTPRGWYVLAPVHARVSP